MYILKIIGLINSTSLRIAIQKEDILNELSKIEIEKVNVNKGFI